MKEHLLFPTVIHTHYIEPGKDTRLLRDIINRTDKKSHVLLESAPSTYGTTQTLLNNPLLVDLKRDLTDMVNNWARTLDICPLEITNSWANVLGPGHRVEYHRHPRSVVSGAFYLTAPKGSVDLEFRNPLMSMKQMESYVWEQTGGHVSFLNESVHSIPCEENLLILFPSWLEHGTSKSNTTTDRITVSFNTHYVDK